MKLDFTSLETALESLQNAILVSQGVQQDKQSATNLQQTVKAGVIQNFEFTYELCWKMLQRWIRHNVSPEDAEPRTRKDLYRLAANQGLIPQPEAWFKYAESRNATSHAYDVDKAEEVYRSALQFVHDAKMLLKALQARND